MRPTTAPWCPCFKGTGGGFLFYLIDRPGAVLGNRRLSILRDMPNVVATPHMAFYTARSVSALVRASLPGCL